MKRLLLAAVISIASVANATTVSGFNGDYAVANWTSSPGTGSIDTSLAPNSISLTSGDDGSGAQSSTNFYIRFLVDATVTFDWDWATLDSAAFYDPFGYVLANAEGDLDTGFAQLTDDSGAASQSGTASVFVMANQYFGFSTFSDSFGGPATTTISGLRIAEIPEPSSLLLLSLALAAAGTATRRRRAA